ncbi:hypothetical protein [Krasilnikovia sp. MM14-A1259]|uniref:hypothetical protein n=1 Tax=Krasilnikovia sp. MM14-A1259 TaxID=3373539 RepID=UPI00381802DB
MSVARLTPVRRRFLTAATAFAAALILAPQAAVAAPVHTAPAPPQAARPQTVTELLAELAAQPQDSTSAAPPADDAGLDRMLAQDLADYDEDPEVRAAAKAVLATNDPAKRCVGASPSA